MTDFFEKFTVANLMDLRAKFISKVHAKYPQLPSIIFLICFAIYLSGMFIKGTTMPGYLISQRLIFLIIAIPTFFVILKILLFDDHSLIELTAFGLLECVLFNIGYHAGDFSLFYFVPFIYGAKNVDYRSILKVFIAINLIGIGISMILALTGVIRNYEGVRSLYSPVTRYALGAVYPTDFAARGFCILMAYAALRRFKFSLPEYISFVAVTIWFYIITDTRLDLMLMLLLLLMIIFYNKEAKLLSNIPNQLMTLLMYIYMGVIFLLGFAYHPGNKFLEIINHLLSGRLTFEALTVQKYNVQLFGQFINQPGGGAFYIDSVFFRTLFMYGIAVFFMFLLLIIAMNKKILSKKAFCLELCFILFFLSGAIDQHFWDSSYNFSLLALYANILPFADGIQENNKF